MSKKQLKKIKKYKESNKILESKYNKLKDKYKTLKKKYRKTLLSAAHYKMKYLNTYLEFNFTDTDMSQSEIDHHNKIYEEITNYDDKKNKNIERQSERIKKLKRINYKDLSDDDNESENGFIESENSNIESQNDSKNESENDIIQIKNERKDNSNWYTISKF